MNLILEDKIQLSDLLLSKRRNILRRNKGKETPKSIRLLKIQQKLFNERK